jgi:WXXGXW repeat (2 copies)
MRTLFSIRSVLLVLGMLAASAASFGQVRIGVAINIEPPELPVYDQPVCPGDGYIWTPGYWAYDDDYGYFWVPGTWVLAPEPGFLWTPGYWAWGDGGYVFYQGYWGPVVGFYGGINYGFGYFGHGYEGGRWEHDHFFYNRSVSNVNVTVIHNTYNTVVENRNVTRVSFNGGNGGVNQRPTREEEAAAHERHIAPVSAQTEHRLAARGNQELRASVNHGKPPVAATSKPAEFKGGGVVAAREGGAVHTNEARPGNEGRPGNNNASRTETNANRPNNIIHPQDIPARERPAAPNTGNPNLDRKYQQQQEKLQQKQDQERQKLQAKQEREHQKADQQRANDARRQQMEQRHQQQTQQLQQRQAQQQQRMQQRQQPPPQHPKNPH